MRKLDLTLPTAIENLALDEALLESLPSRRTEEGDGEVLRLWETDQNLVVIGRSSRIEDEVNLDFCKSSGIQVLRRSSGGASIVTGPGCLMYAVVLDLEKRPELQALDAAHCFVLRKIRAAVAECGGDAAIQGTSDLTIRDKKFSGNSLRLTRHGLLYHGTLLNTFDLELISLCLKVPPRQPDYREQRSHREFLTNMNLDSSCLRQSIVKNWNADSSLEAWPSEETSRLALEKYSSAKWNERI